MAEAPAPAYTDPEYQAAHAEVFSHPSIPGVPVVLPPGVSQENLQDALKELVEVVGTNAVLSGEHLKEYLDPYEIPEATNEKKVPCAAVRPGSVTEVQGVLKIANKYKIPVWTFSRGKNLGYGGPAPVVPGSLALDLHRMNKILEVNEKLSYAVVEPGVTFTDLYAFCATNKLKLWPSTASLGWGSVIGNTLDRGMGFTPTGVHHEHMAGLEVVLANGDVVRTGQFAMSTSPSAHLTRLSFGPTIDSLFLQSNLAIVTKMGINLTPQPQAYMAVTFDMPDIDDIVELVDVFGALRRNGTIPASAFISNITGQTTAVHKHVNWWDKGGPIPDWRIKEIQKELDAGYWIAKFGLYGPKNILQAQYDEVERVLAKEMPKGRIRHTLFSAEDGELLDATTVSGPHGGIFVGVPSLMHLQFVDYLTPQDGSGIGGHGAYSPILPLDGKTVLDWVKSARTIYESHGFDLIADFFIDQRHTVCVSMLFFDKKNPKQRTASNKLLGALFEDGSKRGLSIYRSHIGHMDAASDLFDFNNHAYRRFVETLKDSLDPNGILSPGKMGIWPKRFREQRSQDS